MRLPPLSSPARLTRLYSTNARRTLLGIRSESNSHPWERRSPLTPSALSSLKSLLPADTPIFVQASSKRIYPDSEFKAAGATIVPILPSSCNLVLGIKEPSLDPLLSSEATYVQFTHVHKFQSPSLLSALLCPAHDTTASPVGRVIDWELLTSPLGVRTTSFGHLAGVAGMGEGLHQLGMKLLMNRGVGTFVGAGLKRPWMCRDGEELRRMVRELGERVARVGTGDRPVSIVISGKGRAATGAKDLLMEMGDAVEWIDAKRLRRVMEGAEQADTNKIYACQLELEDYLTDRQGGKFDREAYRAFPERFYSEFEMKIAPYTTLFVNCAFWEPGCPRILTTEQLARVQKAFGNDGRFLAVVDISCDIGGGLEFVTHATTLDNPTINLCATTGLHLCPSTPSTTLISSISILPTSLPIDASEHFSNSILPYVKSLLQDPESKGKDECAKSIRRATIIENGKLVGEWEEKLGGRVKEWREKSAGEKEGRRKVVVLGSGLVAGPAVELLSERKDVDLVVASDSIESAQRLIEGKPNATAKLLDVHDQASLDSLLEGAEVVVSLLPAQLHLGVAESCLRNKASLVTASYISDELRNLNKSAKEASIVILGELGLDPGIDHASAMRLIEQARESGNKITSFISFCGGLPAPELSSSPLGYKFSWSPRGALTALLNPASFLLNSTSHSIPSHKLLTNYFHEVPILKGFKFEGLANRDSGSYLAQYGLSEEKELKTCLRGTLRYEGFVRIMEACRRIGLLGSEELGEAKVEVWTDLVEVCLERGGWRRGLKNEKGRGEVEERIVQLLDGDKEWADEVVEIFRRLSLLPDFDHNSLSLPPIPPSSRAPLDLLSILLGAQLTYAPHESDMVCLRHEVQTTSPLGETELFSSTLIQYGVPFGHSAMATTVGYPVATGALMILDGLITEKGVMGPTNEMVWRPLLERLEKKGLRLVEERRKGGEGLTTRGMEMTLGKQVGSW